MVSYTQNELLSITDFTKSISKILGDIKEHTIEKVGVLKNNKLEAVVISTQEYERLKELEELMNNIEHKEIYEIIQSRSNTPKSEYISIDDMAKKFNTSKARAGNLIMTESAYFSSLSQKDCFILILNA